MVVMRGEDDAERGIPPRQVNRVKPQARGIITSAPQAFADAELPVLSVRNNGDAVLALGRYARLMMRGKLIGVTGSAGKTTMVAMLAQALRPWGKVGTSRLNANLPHGIGWNLASIAWDTPHVVMELAIGRMKQNAALARPDVAVFTNIAAAHLEFHHDLATVARRKSAIFEGMAAGATAILNADMAELARVRALALARGLNIVSYGEAPRADIRMISRKGDFLEAETPSGRMGYHLATPGRHMAVNSLAVLATLHALSLEPDRGMSALEGFRPLAGRGDVAALCVQGKRILLIDEAYNANPASMAASLELLGAQAGGRRVAILGEMLELGPGAEGYHADLAPLAAGLSIDVVHAVGPLYARFCADLPPRHRGIHAPDLATLHARWPELIRDGDIVLVKGSHGSGVHEIVRAIQAEADTTAMPRSPALLAS